MEIGFGEVERILGCFQDFVVELELFPQFRKVLLVERKNATASQDDAIRGGLRRVYKFVGFVLVILSLSGLAMK